MLFNEWNLEEALEVEHEEGFEEGHEVGLEAGRKAGLEEGREAGFEEGREEIARNALAEGMNLEIIRKITGLDAETILGFASH